MTAIIGILNKSAVAVAADSAVTVAAGGNTKVYNYANKIFNLVIGKPIAIMVYNSAEFVGIPWETIIKMYRTYLNHSGFSHTRDYREDFIKFLRTFKTYFDDSMEEKTVTEVTFRIIGIIDRELNSDLREEYTPEDFFSRTPSEIREIHRSKLVDIISSDTGRVRAAADLASLKAVTVTEIKRRHKNLIDSMVNEELLRDYNLVDDVLILGKMRTLIALCLKRNIFMEAYTGLVFTGFGDKEIFPSLYSADVGGVVDKKLRYRLSEGTAIDMKNDAIITPFAQTDIMATFVEGIDPYVRDSIPKVFESALNEFKDHILGEIDFSSEAEKDLKKILNSAVPKVVEILTRRLEGLRFDKHIHPMLFCISSLSKEDLTEMAESLINLTYLKRRASFREESGGRPVDVAVITKGDGFIWIKRKHYFSPELNKNYMLRGISRTGKSRNADENEDKNSKSSRTALP